MGEHGVVVVVGHEEDPRLSEEEWVGRFPHFTLGKTAPVLQILLLAVELLR